MEVCSKANAIQRLNRQAINNKLPQDAPLETKSSANPVKNEVAP